MDHDYRMSLNWASMGLDNHNTLDSLVVALYLLLVLGVGLWSVLRSNRGTVKDFFLAGQNLAWWQIGASLFATNIGSGHLIGLAGIGASSGIAIGAFEWNAIFLICSLGWIFVPIYINAGVVTVPEYLRKRFGCYRVELLFSVLYLFLYIFSRMLLEICYGVMFLRIVWRMDVYQASLILLTVAGIYTITGGLAAVVYTDILHAGFILLGSILLMGYAFNKVGEYQGLLHKYFHAIPSVISEGNWTAKPDCYLPRPDSFHIFRDPITGDIPWPGLVFGLSILSLYYWCTNQVFVQRCLAGKNMSHIKGGCLLCGYLNLLPMFSIVMPGMISRILNPDKVACVVPSECQKYCGSKNGCSPIAYPLLMIELLPNGLRGLMLSTLCASLMSSLTSIFNSASALFTLNIYTQMRPMATEKELMITGRFFVIVLLAVTIALVPITDTAQSEILFEYTQAIRSYVTPPIAAVILLAIFCKRVNEQSAFWGLIVGIIIGFIGMVAKLVYEPWSCTGNSKCPVFICGVHYLYFTMILFVVSLLTMLGISLITDPIPDKHLHRLCWSLRNSPEERVDLDTETQRKRPLEPPAQPDVLNKAQSCAWKAWDLFCGLEPQPGPKLAPEKATEKMEQGGVSEGAEALVPEEATRKMEATEEKTEDAQWGDMLEKPLWRYIVNTNGIILLALVIFGYIYYA